MLENTHATKIKCVIYNGSTSLQHEEGNEEVKKSLWHLQHNKEEKNNRPLEVILIKYFFSLCVCDRMLADAKHIALAGQY